MMEFPGVTAAISFTRTPPPSSSTSGRRHRSRSPPLPGRRALRWSFTSRWGSEALFFLAPKAPNIVAVVCLVRHPPLAVGALVGHPSHLLVAQIGFAVLRAPRRTWPRPNPWPLAQDRVRRRISGEVRRCCSVAVRHSHTTLATWSSVDGPD
jgi:hypothetical protein